MTTTRAALGGEVEQRLADRGGRGGVHAPGGLVDHQHARPCRISRPMTNFCRLPPDSARAACPARRAHVEWAMIRFGEGARRGPSR